MIGDQFLDDLEQELLNEADKNEADDEDPNAINDEEGTDNIISNQKTANKHDRNSIKETIKRTFQTRK